MYDSIKGLPIFDTVRDFFSRRMDNLDDLAHLLAGSSVSVTPNSTMREHPRFSQYKYVGRAEVSQERRRQEFLRRQKE